MNLESVTAVIRPRTYAEAVDLGFRMMRAWWRPVLGAWTVVGLPFLLLTVVSLHRWPTLTILLVWWLKPLFDRVPMYVLSQSLFGAVPTTKQTIRAWPGLLRRDWLASLTWMRLDPMRSFRLPIWQLEGLRGKERGRRVGVLAREARPEALLLTFTCALFELCIYASLFLVLFSIVPPSGWETWTEGGAPLDLSSLHRSTLVGIYLVTVFLIEPFYVAGGFGLYINRRTHLEAWDIEVVFRRMANRLRTAGPTLTCVALLITALLLASPVSGDEPATEAPAESTAEASDTPRTVIDEVLADPIFGAETTETSWQFKESESNRRESKLALGPLGEFLSVVVRAIAWVLAVGALVWGVIQIRRRRPRRKGATGDELEPQPPTQVVGLDVREESLPDDVPAAARELWQSGRRREAIRILYRGALSRLITREGLALQPGATEGDCLELAENCMESGRWGYFRALTEMWVVTAYGQRDPDDGVGSNLIHEWGSHFGGAS